MHPAKARSTGTRRMSRDRIDLPISWSVERQPSSGMAMSCPRPVPAPAMRVASEPGIPSSNGRRFSYPRRQGRLGAQDHHLAPSCDDGFVIVSILSNIFAVIVRFTEAGTNAFMIRFIQPGTILDRFSPSALRPSDTHCSTLIGFIGMVRGSSPTLASTGVFVSAAGTMGTQYGYCVLSTHAGP